MRVINVDERDQELNMFLKKIKFSIFLKLYEMRKHFFCSEYCIDEEADFKGDCQ